jgi:hypothetical protein
VAQAAESHEHDFSAPFLVFALATYLTLWLALCRRSLC